MSAGIPTPRPRNELDDWWDRHILPIAERWAREYPLPAQADPSTSDAAVERGTPITVTQHGVAVEFFSKYSEEVPT